MIKYQIKVAIAVDRLYLEILNISDFLLLVHRTVMFTEMYRITGNLRIVLFTKTNAYQAF